MGVLTEIGAMKCVVVLLAVSWGTAAGCPSLCSCRGGTSGALVTGSGGAGLGAGTGSVREAGLGVTREAGLGATSSEAPGEPLRLRCGGPPALISELKEIDFTDISTYVVSLNMSSNAVATLSRDLHLPNLQKLDLSHNQISLIESDAFYNITALQRLDLSHNQISFVSREMFKGLGSLERLLLDHNLLTTLPLGTFHHLVALKLLDVTENRLVCDCSLVWVGSWVRESGVRLPGGPTCAGPSALAGRSLRKLRVFLDLAACAAEAPPPAALQLRPAQDQLVFEGDPLALVCAAPLASALHKYELRWAHASQDHCELNVTSTDVLDEGAAETTVTLSNVTAQHAGAWTCEYEDEGLGRHSRTVRVTVLSNATRFCGTAVSVDNKGLLSWPAVLLNHSAQVPCRAGAGAARRRCGADGAWAAPDTAQCAYISNVTKLLQQFALLDLSLVPHSAGNASARLAALVRASTYPLALLDDPDDVLFIARAVRNYMRYLPDQPDIGSALLDVVSAAMNVTPGVMARAEAAHGACTALVRAADLLADTDTDKQKSNLAVESFPVRAGFGGATCAWYSAAGAPRLHCTTTNRTVARLLTFRDALIHASVQIPGSLQFALAGGASSGARLAVLVFASAALFPLLPPDAPRAEHRAKDYYGRSTKREDMNMEITSPVVSVQLHNGSLSRELIEPIIATLRAAGCGAGARCAVWDPATQRWQDNSTECRVLHVAGCTWVVSLARPGVLALLARAERGYYGARVGGARFKVSHPAVYVGSLVLLGCLGAAATTYAAAFPALRMPRRAKHALVNTWLAQAALCLLYTLGIYQTEDVQLCRALGLLIHYLSLCCPLWMCVSAHVMYKWVTPRARPAPDADAGPDAPVRRPVLGLYLAGWGIALIVCGISGAVNLQDYAGYAQCFLSTAPALTALLVPGGVVLLFLAALFLLVRCAIRDANVQLSEGTQATEHVDLELWEPPPAPERASLRSADSEPEDLEHAPIVQLRAQAIVLALHLAAWGSGAVAVYRPLPAYLPYQEDICSIVYAVCATVLGTFTLFFYGIARSDVRAQWSMMHCYLQKSKQCCRNRSVYDSNRQNLPPAPPAPLSIPNDNRSRSGSRSSNRTNSKTNNSAIYRAGAELNGQTLQKDLKNTNGKSPNINLVVLHRQQYRSNNSMMTYPDAASVPPEAFYNPNQMNVAKKFFKKQRQHMKRNCLELPLRRDFDNDSHVSLPLPSREAYGVASIINAGSKVNNTNLHVERSAGIKEPRHANNPNLLDEEHDYKSYSTDRKSWNKGEDPKGGVMNIYTNVPETLVPQHQVVPRATEHEHEHEQPDTRTVSQQCSLEYSSASELAPHSASEHTLDTSELTEPAEPSAAAETTDTDSFGQYVDYRRQDDKEPVDKSLQDISEECTTTTSEDATRAGTDEAAGERDSLLTPDEAKGKEEFFAAKTTYDFESCSTNASEHGENESDIYCPNYQVSEVSIRSHGLYAPSPSSMCPNEMGFSAEDVSHAESQYVNLDPGWRSAGAAQAQAQAARDSPSGASASDLDELYSQITARRGRAAAAPDALDATARSDVTLRPGSDASDLDELYSQITARRGRAAAAPDALDATARSDVTLRPGSDASDLDELYSQITARRGRAAAAPDALDATARSDVTLRPGSDASDLDELYSQITARRGRAAAAPDALDELYSQITARRGRAAAAPDALDATARSDVTLRPGSDASDLDELYSQITARRGRAAAAPDALDATARSDVTLRPGSDASDLDELYSQITARRGRAAAAPDALDATARSDVTLRPGSDASDLDELYSQITARRGRAAAAPDALDELYSQITARRGRAAAAPDALDATARSDVTLRPGSDASDLDELYSQITARRGRAAAAPDALDATARSDVTLRPGSDASDLDELYSQITARRGRAAAAPDALDATARSDVTLRPGSDASDLDELYSQITARRGRAAAAPDALDELYSQITARRGRAAAAPDALDATARSDVTLRPGSDASDLDELYSQITARRGRAAAAPDALDATARSDVTLRPGSDASDLDELYSQITARRGRAAAAPDALDATARSDVTLRPGSDASDDEAAHAHEGTLKGTLV